MEKYISMLLTIVIIVFSLLSILLNFNLRKFVMSLSKYKNQNFWKVTGRFLKYIFSIDPLYQYLSSSKLKRFSVIGVIIFMCILLLSSFYTTASIRYDSVSLVRFLIISFIISWIIIGLAASLIYKLLYFMLTSVQQLKVHKSLNTVDPFFLFTVPVMFMFMFFTSDISDKQPWLVYVMLVPIYICHFNILKSMLLTAFNSDLLVIDKYKSDIYNKFKVIANWFTILFTTTYFETILTEVFEEKPKGNFALLLNTFSTFTTLDIPEKTNEFAQVQSLVTSSSGVFFIVIFIATVLTTEMRKQMMDITTPNEFQSKRNGEFTFLGVIIMINYFIVNNKYSRKDVYKIVEVPKEKQGGNWNTGYTKFKDDLYIFSNINSAGRTGHDYNNKFLGDYFQWFSKGTHGINSATLKYILNPKGNIYIFTRNSSKELLFTYHGLGKVKLIENSHPTRILWSFIDHESQITQPIEENEELELYYEGNSQRRIVNTYERNFEARQKCIEHYGFSCAVCDIRFENVYGSIGEDFIEVHHLVELNQIGKRYAVDPIKDLRPVCPNCHAMLHRKKPAYTIEELKNLMLK